MSNVGFRTQFYKKKHILKKSEWISLNWTHSADIAIILRIPLQSFSLTKNLMLYRFVHPATKILHKNKKLVRLFYVLQCASKYIAMKCKDEPCYHLWILLLNETNIHFIRLFIQQANINIVIIYFRVFKLKDNIVACASLERHN